MRRTLLLTGLLTLAVPQAAAAPGQRSFLSFSDARGIAVAAAGGSLRRLAPNASAAAWTRDGRRVAFVRRTAAGTTDVYVADADGTHLARLTRTPTVDEESPAWSPDGRSLVVVRDGSLVVVRADRLAERVLGAGHSPDWSPGGRTIVFAADGGGNDDLFVVRPDGHGRVRLTATPANEGEPAWAPDGRRIAFAGDATGNPEVHVLDTRTRAVARLTYDAAVDHAPAWSPDGARLAFTTERQGFEAVWTMTPKGERQTPAVPGLAFEPAWRPSPRIRELLPDLDQRPPADLSPRTVTRRGRKRFVVGFASATDNVGEGPVSIAASRPGASAATMRARQRVRLSNGGTRSYRRVGVLRYVFSPSHSHWHLLRFQSYELRRADDHRLVVRDNKSGFCLADHYGEAPGPLRYRAARPAFRGRCATGNAGALAVDQGTSVGYTDRYPSHFHGQNVDVTGVPPGRYVLVHRSNPSLLLRELRYTNNAASLLIRLTWPNGRSRRPHLVVLRTCPSSERCG